MWARLRPMCNEEVCLCLLHVGHVITWMMWMGAW